MRRHPRASELAARWVLLADDDTFVQVDELLDFVSRYDAALPALFGYVLSDAHVLGYDYPCGGAGMLLSASAYDLLAPRILTDCPLLAFNDLTLGFCAHSQGVPMIHQPHMHCAPDLNRAMRPQENLLDIQKALAVHRLIGFQSFTDLVGTLEMLKGQLRAVLQHGCRLAASAARSDTLDSRRFFWSLEAFPEAVRACRGGAPRAALPGALELNFLIFKGQAVAGYHRERAVPLLATGNQRWPDWMEQLKHLECTNENVTWKATWRSVVPRLSRLQLESTGYGVLAENAQVTEQKVEESFKALEKSQDSWLQELKKFLRPMKLRRLSGPAPGWRWLFVSFAAETFLNVFESQRLLRSLSELYHPGRPQLGDVREPVDLGSEEPPPLALAYAPGREHIGRKAMSFHHTFQHYTTIPIYIGIHIISHKYINIV